MSITEREKAKLVSRSPKTRNGKMPDATWKAQQAFIRATRRGSKKHSGMSAKLELLDSATKAIPAPTKLVLDQQTGKPVPRQTFKPVPPRVRAAVAKYLSDLVKKEPTR